MRGSGPSSVMQRAVRLSLITPLYYYPSELTIEKALKKADKEGIGYDAVIKYSFTIQDEKLVISRETSGERSGYTKEEKKAIESGETIDRKNGEDMEIAAGQYLFEQLPFIPEEKDLSRLILPYIKKNKGSFFVRIYKESFLECIMQLLFPSP